MQRAALAVVDNARLGGLQHSERFVERARFELGPRRRQGTLCAALGLSCERGGPVQKGSGGGQPAAGLRASGSPLELGGDGLVRAGCRLGQMPGAPVGIGRASVASANAW